MISSESFPTDIDEQGQGEGRVSVPLTKSPTVVILNNSESESFNITPLLYSYLIYYLLDPYYSLHP